MSKNREGQKVPNVTFRVRKNNEWVNVTSADIFDGKTVVVFSLPGAYTPTCSAKHLPGYVEKAAELKQKIDEIWCVSVNDAFVMGAWGRENNATGAVRMMADGSAEFTKAVGMDLDLEGRIYYKR